MPGHIYILICLQTMVIMTCLKNVNLVVVYVVILMFMLMLYYAKKLCITCMIYSYNKAL